MLDLEEILRMLGKQNDDRNGVQNAGVYVPPTTRFQAFDNDPNLLGYVRPIGDGNTAHIGINNDDDINQLYTVFHEAAHTAQPPINALNGSIRAGPYAPLSDLPFKDYPYPTGKPPVQETLATLRGAEAMMPTGKTIWDMNKLEPGHTAYNGPEEYLAQVMKSNPRLTREGAKRLIETQMFPEHSLMHEPTDFVPNSPRSLMDLIRRYIK